MKRTNLKLAFSLVLLVASATQAAVPASCSALLKIKDDLWFFNSNGKLTQRLTWDGRMKYAVALSPNGKVIAYSGVSFNGVTLLDASGRVLGQVDVGTKDAITNLVWVGTNLLQVGEHVNPSTSQFHFLQISSDSYNGATLLPTTTTQGQSCQLAPNGRDVACTVSDAITLNNHEIFYAPTGFDSAVTIQNIQAIISTTIALKSVPGVSVTVVDASPETIHLKLTLPDETWQEHYTTPGNTIPIHFGDETLYGIKPMLSGDSQVVLLSVVQSTTGASFIETGPVWDVSGRRLAFVQANGIGQRELTVLNKELGTGAINKNVMRGAIDGQTMLPIAGPISTIQFLTDTSLKVIGPQQIYLATIPAQGKIRDWKYTLSDTLPTQLNVQTGTASQLFDVIGWTCP